MEQISFVTSVLGVVEPYWPFVIKVLAFWYLGQFFKRRVWTRDRAEHGGSFWKLMRDTLPIHPIASGVMIGLCYPSIPAVGFISSRGGAVLEGVLAGFTSVAGYVALEYVAKARGWGAVLHVLHGTIPARESVVPSEPPPPLEPPAT
jgi:hypothetical protein